MVKKTSSPKSSSSSSVSRNPPATTQSYEMGSFSMDPWFNVDDVPIWTIPKTSMGCLSDEDSGKEQINGVQEERFTFMGSSLSSNPRIAEDQSMASLASINEGDFVGKYPSLLDEIKPNDQNPLYLNKILIYANLEVTYPLMFDPEGTYSLKNLYHLYDSSRLKLIVEELVLPDLLKVAAKNDTGPGAHMKRIEVLINITKPLLHKFILCALDSEFLSMMTTKHGSRLFRLILKDLDPLQTEFLYNRAAAHCTDLATDTTGYASLIALIENTPNPYKKVLLLKIWDNVVCLSQDPKGNYVVQATLLLQYPELDCMICKKLAGTYLYLSIDKYASNVVQKCIMSSGMEYPILELIFSKDLHLFSRDPVGNYVVQVALQATRCSRLDLYDRIVGEIEPHLKDLQYHLYGRHVFQQISYFRSLE